MDFEFVHKALNIIRLNTAMTGHWIPSLQRSKLPDGVDGQIAFDIDKGSTVFNADIKSEVRNYQLQQILADSHQHAPLIVMAKRIFPKMREALRDHGIAYFEENGNFFLKYGATHILIDGKRPLAADKEKVNRAFTKTGLKVIFEFLMDEKLINEPYRVIAKRTNTGTSNINYIVNGLKSDGFLVSVQKDTYRLIRKKTLLDKWVGLYAQKLKPSLQVGQFRLLRQEDFENWKRLPLRTMETWWGGEPAGDLLTNYLKPAILTLYTVETRDKIIRHYRLIPDEGGSVEVYRRFWEWNEVNDNIVPPLLVYADLMNTGEPRCIETAKKVYDELLASQFPVD